MAAGVPWLVDTSFQSQPLLFHGPLLHVSWPVSSPLLVWVEWGHPLLYPTPLGPPLTNYNRNDPVSKEGHIQNLALGTPHILLGAAIQPTAPNAKPQGKGQVLCLQGSSPRSTWLNLSPPSLHTNVTSSVRASWLYFIKLQHPPPTTPHPKPASIFPVLPLANYTIHQFLYLSVSPH